MGSELRNKELKSQEFSNVNSIMLVSSIIKYKTIITSQYFGRLFFFFLCNTKKINIP